LFKNRSFAIGGIGSIVMGAGMFGGILLLPQYLQIVQGSSATVAGLQMIPLVAGIMAGAMGSGIAISRTGKYKAFPLVGIALMVTALLSMSFIVEADTSVWTLVPFMVLLGLGLGFNFQPVILAVQNSVSPREMGVATSSVTFFRQMGGTIGVAAFLSILFTRLPGDIEAQIETTVRANPELAPQFERLGGAATDLSDTSFIQRLPDAVAYPFKAGFSDSIDAVFLIAALVVAIGFFVFLFLPQLALSEKSGIQALQEDDADGRGTAVTPDVEANQPAQAAGAAAPTSTAPPAGTAEDPRGR
ncbi:MAG: Drug resistance transporter, EmrB/QacA subfamily, partial [Blastococcus sp.]|nr:Drug resistance transporter, EmrB/QacA subfamily [Blastococcus sp.]